MPTTNQGLDVIAGSSLAAAAQQTTWYVGLINLTGFTGLNAGDTMASHPGWTEFTGYSGSRPQWVNFENGGVASSNGPFTFPITTNGVIHGMFITSDPTVGGAAGKLLAASALPSDAVATAGASITGTYTATLVGG